MTIRVGGTCADRVDVRDEAGPVSRLAHETLEPAAGERGPDLHAINCDVLVQNGL